MISARERIQAALDRCGVSLRRLAAVSGVITSSHLSKYLRGITFETQHERILVETAETLADLIQRGELFKTDSVARMKAAVAADRAKTAQSLETLRFLGV